MQMTLNSSASRRLGAPDYAGLRQSERNAQLQSLRLRARSLNLSAYVENDPVNQVDPNGENFALVSQLRCAGYEWNCSLYYYFTWVPDPPTRIGGDLFGEPIDRGGGGGGNSRAPRTAPTPRTQCGSHPFLDALGKLNGGVNTAIGLAAAGA